MRAAIYARVSSKVQKDRHTIESQLRDLPAYVQAQGWDLVGTYVDDGRSAKAGKLEARDGFARLVVDAALRKFDVLVVVDIDRLTRTEDMMERATILSPFQKAGIDIVTPSGGRLDLRSFLGELYTTMMAMLAAEENRKRSLRTKAGKRTAIDRGKSPGGPVPYGFRYDRISGAWSVDADEVKVIVEIFERAAAGESCYLIATSLTARGVYTGRGAKWSRGHVWKVLHCQAYLGRWLADKQAGRTVVVPVVVDADLFHAAHEALLRHKKRGLSRTRHVYLLEGIATCSQCGAQIGVQSSWRPKDRWTAHARYVCTRRRRPLGGPRCTLPTFRVADVDARLWAGLVEAVSQGDILERVHERNQSAPDDRALWEKDRADAERKIERLAKSEAEQLGLSRRGLISASGLEASLLGIQRERRALETQVSTANKAIAAADRKTKQREASADVLVRAREMMTAASPQARRAVVRALLDPGSVIVSDEEVTAMLGFAAMVSCGGDRTVSGRESIGQTPVRIRLLA